MQHHPTICLYPKQDYPDDSLIPVPATADYVLQISTHTHTPLPMRRYTKLFPGSTAGQQTEDMAKKDDKPNPGVTRKDLQLALVVEEAMDKL